MCLKNASERQLLEEVSKRIQMGKINWKFTYFCGENKTEMSLICQNNDNWALSFIQPAEIERNYFARQLYKNLKPTILKIEARKGETTTKSKVKEYDKALELLKDKLNE